MLAIGVAKQPGERNHQRDLCLSTRFERFLPISHRGSLTWSSLGRSADAPSHPPLECVIIDLDGVLTDTAEYHYLAWKRQADEQGIPFDRSVNDELRGVSRAESLQIILRHEGKSLPAEEKASLADRKNSYCKALIGTISPKNLLPGIPLILARLKAENIRTAIASESHNVWEAVHRLEIGPMIDLVVDPEIFLRAAEELGVPVENCAGVEDAQAGVQAIKAARMFAVGIGAELLEADGRLLDTRDFTYEEFCRRFAARMPSGLQPTV